MKVQEDCHAVEHLSSLGDLKIDLTQYLMTQQPAPVSEEVQVVKTKSAGNKSTFLTNF